MLNKYKIDCPYCKNKIIIKIEDNKIIEVSHNDEKISTSEIPDNRFEFG